MNEGTFPWTRATKSGGRGKNPVAPRLQADDVAGLEGGDQDLLDVGEEADAIDRTVDDARGGQVIAAQGGEEGQRAPVAVRHLVDQRQAASAPAAQARHVGLGPGFVDEDEPGRIRPALELLPLLAPSRHLGPQLLGGKNAFF